MKFDPAIFIGKFVEEARDRLKALSAALLQLERSPADSRDAIDEALRQAHSLKGSALMLGLHDISQLSHHLEDLFVAARRDASVLDSAAFDLIFASVDRLSERTEQLAKGVTEPMAMGDLSDKLKTIVPDPEMDPDRIPLITPPPAPPPAPAKAGALEPPESGRQRMPEMRQSLRVPVEKLDRLTHLAPELVVQSLKAFERHTELRRFERILSKLRDRVREARIAPETSEQDRGAQLGEYADALDALTRRMREFLVNFSDDRVRLNLITEELRQNVIELTMLPVASVFDAFPRAVRDLARTFNKEVELTIRGRETELDKRIIEQIAEPLIHLIRNSVDHGIGLPDVRMAKGKPAAGQLTLSAEQQGNRILITLKDDGLGIDLKALRAAAVQRGIATETQIALWTTEQLYDLIFRPGFSTRATATDVSGRGVGMDVVRSVVERLGGAVRVQSEEGRGTTITLNLPLTLALLRVVLVEAADELFAFPTGSVRRILQLSAEEVTQLQEGAPVEIAGEAMPITTLAGALQIPSRPADGRQTALVAESGDSRFALLVDAVHEEQELVFKELRGPLRNQRTFTGAALLGNGDIVPILDVSALFDLASHAPLLPVPEVMEPRPVQRATRVLVVDDSLVAGELQKNILLTAGYEAEIAGDGVHALEMLRQKEWDLVIADVDMPRMNGFELTRRLRTDDHFREMPVIIVTSRDSIDDRRRGFEVGADAYVLKREFDQTQLLDTVRRLVGGGAHASRSYA
jgi:two-component system chemotaxis sensor kinase CheA